MGVELELKFQVPEAALPAVVAALKAADARRESLRAQYVDTADGLLGRSRIALRLRREGRRWVQTLKAEGDSAVHRLEDNVPVRVRGADVPLPDPSRHAGTPAGQVLQRVLDAAGGPPLQPVLVTEFTRLAARIVRGGSVVEVCLDEGRVTAGERSSPLRELELELVGGEPADLFALARQWCAAHGLWLDTVSKAERGALLQTGASNAAPVRAAPPAVDRTMGGALLMRRWVAAVLRQALPNASALADGSDDAEHLHQLRVALRRLRTLLRETPAWARGLDVAVAPAVDEAFHALGRARDAAAVMAAVRPMLVAAQAPLIDLPAPVDLPRPQAVVRAPALQQAFIALLDFAMSAPPPAGATPGAAESQALIAERLEALQHRVRRDARHFESLPLDAQHHVRLRVKRLRDLAGFAAPLWSPARAARLQRRLVPVLDALGAHRDIVVAAQRYADHAAQDEAALFALGFLRGQVQAGAHRAGEALRAFEPGRPWRHDPADRR